MRGRFGAAARDLGLALSGLQAVVAADVAPTDVAEDVVAAQRQLGLVRFSSAAAHEQLAAQLLQVRRARAGEQGDWGLQASAALGRRQASLAGLPHSRRDSRAWQGAAAGATQRCREQAQWGAQTLTRTDITLPMPRQLCPLHPAPKAAPPAPSPLPPPPPAALCRPSCCTTFGVASWKRAWRRCCARRCTWPTLTSPHRSPGCLLGPAPLCCTACLSLQPARPGFFLWCRRAAPLPARTASPCCRRALLPARPASSHVALRRRQGRRMRPARCACCAPPCGAGLAGL